MLRRNPKRFIFMLNQVSIQSRLFLYNNFFFAISLDFCYNTKRGERVFVITQERGEGK